MRIIVKKLNSHWLAQFDDDSEEAGIGSNAGTAVQDLLENSPNRNLTIHDFKPAFSDSGSKRIIMVTDAPA